jgi:uncharacterized protein YndB with AHSA1/START domain
MTVTDVRKDLERATMTVITEFDAPVGRVWQLWADPRQLERWWGPPTYPATVTDHDLSPGGLVRYHMTGPEGDQPAGLWRVLEVEAPHRLKVEDLFADEYGEPNLDMPVSTMEVVLVERPQGGTRMTIESRFASTEAMAQLVAMGVEEGMMAALGQIEAILLEPSTG